MTNLPPALVELLKDPQGKRAEAQLGPLVESLKAEGIPPRAICRALAHVLITNIMEEYERWDEHRTWARRFLLELIGGLQTTSDDITNAELRFLAARRNREAGGDGTSVQ